MTRSRAAALRRRAVSVPSVVAAAVLLSILFVPLAASLVVVDLVRGRHRLPLVRLTTFAWCWAWLETFGVAAAAGLWLVGRARDEASHYRLQRWWADRLMRALRATCGARIEVDGADALSPGPTVLLVRHASLADSLLTAWVTTEAGLRPRVVLKQELEADPCLDIVGHRLPNCFIDRGAEDSAPSLSQLRRMGATMRSGDVAVIFPEGTRANAAKRQRALERIAATNPERAERLAELQHLLPPRPAGTAALLEGARGVEARVALAWHVGFDGLDTFGGIVAALGRPRTTVRMQIRRVAPPDDASVGGWLDEQWLQVDRAVSALEP
jgi:1-acyl-sn-glycerol-3-phosphate acyltransferase